MAVSGTVSTTVFNTNKILDTAFRRCKVAPETVTSEMQETALNSLYLFISQLCNRGIPLWTVEKIILPLYWGNAYVPMPAGTIDLLNTNYRWLSRFNAVSSSSSGVAVFADDNNLQTACTQDAPNGYIIQDLGTAQLVTTIGINMLTGDNYNLVVSYSNDNISWTNLISPGSVTYGNGEWNWYDLNPTIQARYWKLQELGGATLNVAEFYVAGNPTEIPIARLNQDDYTNLPNKTFQGRPLQFWFDRQLEPVARLWPVPDNQSIFAQFVSWRERHIMDVGDLTGTIEFPQRWIDAITWVLAHRLCFEIKEVPIEMANILGPIAEQQLASAFNEERDNSPFMMSPNISMYTR